MEVRLQNRVFGFTKLRLPEDAYPSTAGRGDEKSAGGTRGPPALD